MMPTAAFKHRFHLTIACLLSLCLSSTAAEARQRDLRDDMDAHRLAYTLDAATVLSVMVPAEKRTRPKNGDPLIFFCHAQTHAPFYGASFAFYLNEYIDFINAENHFPFPIRASPSPLV